MTITVNPKPAPVTDFTYSHSSGTAPLMVSFTGSCTETPTSWSWDFGDGSTWSTQQNPAHVFSNPGTYQVSVTARFGDGTTSKSASKTVTVTAPVVLAPVAAFSPDKTSGTAPLSVHFTDQSFHTPSIWSWDFGDGGSSSSQSPDHAYESEGTYTVTLTVTNSGGHDSTTKKITVSKPAEVSGTSGGDTSGGSGGTSGDGSNGSENSTPQVSGTSGLGQATPTASATPAVAATPAAGFALPASNLILQGVAATLLLLLVVLSGFVFLLALVYNLYIRSRLTLATKKSSLICDGVSTLPIRIQFKNAIGMIRQSKHDREIELETTAGSIQTVVLPAGKDYLDAVLKSSRECGPVVIKGRYKDQTASAHVSFVPGTASLELTAAPDTIPADGASKANITVKFRDSDFGGYFTCLEEKTVNMTATMGKIPSSLKVPAGAQYASGTLISEENSGVAAVAAACGPWRGAVNVTLKGMPKRYCMLCGAPMSMEASRCEKCGSVPPSGTDVKTCGNCGTIIPEAAKFCHYCGARQPDAK